MGWDWEWMQHCVEIMKIFNQGTGAYFYISDQGLNLLRRLAKQNREWN
jgi:hypothetical protein